MKSTRKRKNHAARSFLRLWGGGGEQTLLHRLVPKCEEVILIIHNKRAEVSFFGSRIADSFPVYMPLF